MLVLLVVVALTTAAIAVKSGNSWLWGICALAIAAAIWEGRSRGMWLTYDFEESDASDAGSSGVDSGGGGDGGGD